MPHLGVSLISKHENGSPGEGLLFLETLWKRNIMSKFFGRGKRIGSAARTNRTKKRVCSQTRRIGFESLEDRRLLSSVGLNAISNVTLPAGTSIMVALNGSDPSGKTVNFGVTTSRPDQVTPIVMPQTNKSVQFNINGLGTMTFQLFDNLTPNTASHIETLVNDGFYNGDYIYRAQSGFVVQGGNDPSPDQQRNGYRHDTDQHLAFRRAVHD